MIDAETLEETRRLTTSRVPWSLALSPDGEKIFVTNTLSGFVPPRTPPMSEVTVIDARRGAVEDRFILSRPPTSYRASPGTRAASSRWSRSTAPRTWFP